MAGGADPLVVTQRSTAVRPGATPIEAGIQHYGAEAAQDLPRMFAAAKEWLKSRDWRAIAAAAGGFRYSKVAERSLSTLLGPEEGATIAQFEAAPAAGPTKMNGIIEVDLDEDAGIDPESDAHGQGFQVGADAEKGIIEEGNDPDAAEREIEQQGAALFPDPTDRRNYNAGVRAGRQFEREEHGRYATPVADDGVTSESWADPDAVDRLRNRD